MTGQLKKRVAELEFHVLPLVYDEEDGKEFDPMPGPGKLLGGIITAVEASYIPNQTDRLQEFIGQCVCPPENGEELPVQEIAAAVGCLMSMSGEQQREFFRKEFDTEYSPLGEGSTVAAGPEPSEEQKRFAAAVGYLESKATAKAAGRGGAGRGNGRAAGKSSTATSSKSSPAQSKHKKTHTRKRKEKTLKKKKKGTQDAENRAPKI